MTDDDLIAKYAAEAKQSFDAEANKRIQETTDPAYEQNYGECLYLTSWIQRN